MPISALSAAGEWATLAKMFGTRLNFALICSRMGFEPSGAAPISTVGIRCMIHTS